MESPVGQHDVDVASSVALLETLPVKGRAPKTGYSRDQFGQAWSDDVDVEFGHDGCDTRNNLLASRLTDVVFKEGKKLCVVLSGTLADPYTGKTINFVRGQDTSTAVQIDHVVALSDSWQKGAQQLSLQERTNLANDPRNLIPVDGPTNAKKSDSDAASWLPPNKSYRCTYVSKQITVKSIYRLWVTQAEKDAMSAVLSAC
ncbi:HNH endonuclease family protein [Rhodococcus sp. WY5]|uniref:HNH endonuclease family protein n=1 Tax=Rhodococcus sp. WY5 TaxID=2708349 RepID=UPI0026B1E997